MKAEIIIRSQSQRDYAVRQIDENWQGLSAAGTPLIVRMTEEDTRTAAQNRMLHSQLGDISKQVAWQGKKLSIDVWKRLTTATYLRELDENPQMIPALDGKGFDVIYERTSKLGVRKMSGLIEWIGAFGAEHDVVWTKFGKVPVNEW
jgi:hypothetical protein